MLFAAGPEQAEGPGFAVSVSVAMNTPLTATLQPTVVVEDQSGQPHDATVVVTLRVGDVSLGVLANLNVHATEIPVRVSVPVAASVRERVAAIARRTGHARGSVAFTVSGPGFLRVTQQSFVSLRPPVRTSGPTPIAVGRSTLIDSHHEARGTVTLATPKGWERTSLSRAPTATFTGIPVAGSCTADVLALPQVLAMRSVATIIPSGLRFPGLREGSAGGVTWQVIPLPSLGVAPSVFATAARAVAPHRSVVVKVRVSFTPDCARDAALEPALLSALQRAVSRLTAHVELRRRTA